jgi:uncharacterized membrane protein
MTARRLPPKPKSAARHPHQSRLAVARLPRHYAFYLALVAGALVFAGTIWFWPILAFPFAAIAMFSTYLTLVALMMPALTSDFLDARADEADTPVVLIFGAVLVIVAASCASLFMALNGQGGPLLWEVVLSVVSVLLGWFTVHTMAALHYAYEYYQSETANPKGEAGPLGGLEFPEGDAPDGLAFLYFAYVIGVAFAVSDIRVTSNKMRRIVLIHATFAYFFNTLIVAATVNVAVAVGNI